MVSCSVDKCGSKSKQGSGRRFFSIPTAIKNQCNKTRLLSNERRKLWLLRINRMDLLAQDASKNTTVCDLHFVSGSPSKLFDSKSPDWAPSIGLNFEKSEARILAEEEIKKVINGKEEQKTKANDTSVKGIESVTIIDKGIISKNDSVQKADKATNSDIKFKNRINKGFKFVEIIDTPIESNEFVKGINQTIKLNSNFIKRINKATNSEIKFVKVMDKPVASNNVFLQRIDKGIKPNNDFINRIDKAIESNKNFMKRIDKGLKPDDDLLKGINKPIIPNADFIKRIDKAIKQNNEIVNRIEAATQPEEFVITIIEPKKSTDKVVKRIQESHNKPVKKFKSDAACLTNNAPSSMTEIDILKSELEILKSELERTRYDNNFLRSSNQTLTNKLNHCIISQESLENDNDKVKFYTGIPVYSILKSVFDLVTKDKNFTLQNTLCPFQEFLVVILRLRLNLLEKDLAYRFGVSQATVSRIYSRWLPLMSDRLSCFIAWPDRDSLRTFVPQLFKDIFKDKVCVIFSSVEFFITRPTSQFNFKKTGIKFLLGMTPQGSVAFVSRASAGSDDEIIENCGILNYLAEDDVVILNRDSKDNAGFSCGTVIYTDKPQVFFQDLVPAKNLIEVKKYVEHIVGLVRKKYHILQGTLSPDVLAFRKGQAEAPIDHIVVICCALTNLCRSIVIDSTEKQV